MIETIDRAAILWNDEEYSVPRPGRHHTVLRLIASKEQMERKVVIRGETQGFITSSGRFVDRIEGAEIDIKSGQIAKLSWPPNLYSEDLW